MATAKLLDVLAERLPLVYSAVLVLAFTVAAQYLFRSDPLASIPFVGAELGGEDKRRQAFLKNARSIYMDGYKKFKNTVFRVTTTAKSNIIVVPTKYLEELKKLPDDVLSFNDAVYETMASKYTKLITGDTTVTHTVRGNLTPALPKINPILTEEVARAVREEIRAGKEWTEININQKLLRIVAIVSGRVFLGPELCHDERYIDAAINYTVEIMKARNAVMSLKPWQRRFRAGNLPEVKRLHQREEEFDAIIQPIVHARRLAERTDPGYVKPDDMLQWLLDAKAKEGVEHSDKSLAKGQLILSFAAIHTTTMNATNAFYDLAAHPDLIPELREECYAALKNHGGVFTSVALQGMKKLDSCLKESMRINPPGFVSFIRMALKPFKLSNGLVIPKGSIIEVPSYPQSLDPDVFENPDVYDGLRFYRLREASDKFSSDSTRMSAVQANAHNQFVSVNQHSLTFGYGRHACPGRFFAANEIKMIVARAIMEYDMKLAGDATERYPSLVLSGAIVPDPTKTLLFREAS